MEKNHNFDSLDLFLNEAYWAHLSTSRDLLPLKKQVLSNLVESFIDLDIPFLYDARTYHDIFTYNSLKNEIFIDEIIIKSSNKHKLLKDIKVLERKGFFIIKSHKKETFFINSKRIVNIKYQSIPFFFTSNFHKHFENTSSISKTNKILNLYLLRKLIFNRKFILKKLINLVGFKKKSKTVKFTTLKLSEFLQLNVEAKNSINWSLRKPHLDIVTKNKRYIKVDQIIKYLKRSGQLEKLKMEVVEVDTSSIFDEPIHLNKRFWHSGNNFYFYPVLFGFKKDVVNYTSTNNYVQEKIKPTLYTRDYYEKLENMEENEIANLFQKSPLEITNGSVTSGRHRTFAMIGRIVEGKNYIPIYTKVVSK